MEIAERIPPKLKFKKCDDSFISFATDFIINLQRSYSNLSGFVRGGSTTLNEWRQQNEEIDKLYHYYKQRRLAEVEQKKIINSYSAL